MAAIHHGFHNLLVFAFDLRTLLRVGGRFEQLGDGIQQQVLADGDMLGAFGDRPAAVGGLKVHCASVRPATESRNCLRVA